MIIYSPISVILALPEKEEDNRSKRHSNCPLVEISLIENVNKIKEDF